jgi:hypothetical protein
LPSLAESKQHLAHSGAQAKGQEGYECVSQQTPQTGLEVQHPTGHSYRQGLHLLSCLKEQVVVLASKPKSVPFHIVGPDNNWGPTWDKWKDRNVEFLRFLENATHTHTLSPQATQTWAEPKRTSKPSPMIGLPLPSKNSNKPQGSLALRTAHTKPNWSVWRSW